MWRWCFVFGVLLVVSGCAVERQVAVGPYQGYAAPVYAEPAYGQPAYAPPAYARPAYEPVPTYKVPYSQSNPMVLPPPPNNGTPHLAPPQGPDLVPPEPPVSQPALEELPAPPPVPQGTGNKAPVNESNGNGIFQPKRERSCAREPGKLCDLAPSPVAGWVAAEPRPLVPVEPQENRGRLVPVSVRQQ